MKPNSTVAVVLPTHGGDSEGLSPLLRDLAVAAFALDARGHRLAVVLMDDPSTAVGETAVKAGAQHGLDITVCAAPADVGGAYLAGFQAVLARGDVDLVVTLDSSGRHDPMQIPHLAEQMAAADADVIVGSRWARGSGTPGLSFRRWLRGRAASLTFRVITGARPVLDATTSFRVARATVVRDFVDAGPLADGPLNSYTLQTSFIAFCAARGYKVIEGPIIYRFAGAREPRLTLGDVAEFVHHLTLLRTETRALSQQRLAPARRSFSPDRFGAAAELERLGTSRHFFTWVLEEFHPYLRGRVLEVGAGIGTITRLLADRYPELRLVALEPAGNVFPDLSSFAALTPRVTAQRATLAEYGATGDEGFDAIMYLNVLEHIEDDGAELRLAAAALRPGGAVLVFGPALESLYSELDYRAGHYRRYSIAQLRALLEDAELTPLHVGYFDVLGVLPYLLVYRLLGRDSISGTSMWGYDRVLVPLSRQIQRAIPSPPLGKNVIAVAVKR